MHTQFKNGLTTLFVGNILFFGYKLFNIIVNYLNLLLVLKK
nr:MAG TPA_asm: hypothetical protein [Caudoviricetes sp.]